MRKLTTLSKLMYFIPLLAALWVNSAQAGAYGVNLVVNGDAEAQHFPGSLITNVTGWVGDGHLGVYAYQTTNDFFPSLSSPGPSDRGANFFFGGYSYAASNQASAYQDIDLSFAATEIDAGAVTYDFSGWLGGYTSQSDSSVLTVSFYSAAGQVLGNASLGPVTPVDRQNMTGLQQRSATGAPPVGTRGARVTMTMTRVTGTDDGTADNIQLVLNSTSVTDVVSSSVIRLFNWGEDSYPSLFSPKRPQAGVMYGYQYRCYDNTGACLGVKDGHVWYVGPASNGQIVDVGLFEEYLGQALSAGY